jgi:hypothetical protein
MFVGYDVVSVIFVETGPGSKPEIPGPILENVLHSRRYATPNRNILENDIRLLSAGLMGKSNEEEEKQS